MSRVSVSDWCPFPETMNHSRSSLESPAVFWLPSLVTSSNTMVVWSNATEPTTSVFEPRNGVIRWYDPITGRWLSNDPIGISGGLNQYVFCGNNPVNFRDPFGLDPAETGFMGISQTMAGYLDGLLFGVLPNQDNANYRAGQTVGDEVSLAGGVARLGYAGAAKGSSLLLRKVPTLANAMKAVARRNTLKKVFRLNPWSEFRIYPYDAMDAKYLGDLLEIIKASGRTNPYLNLLGGSMAGHGLYDLLGDGESTPSPCDDACK